MTPLRKRFIEDMQLRGLASTTQRQYIHHVVGLARFYSAGPENLDLEAIRQYELYLLNERKLSPESIGTFVSAVKFLYLVPLEMPWGQERFRASSPPACRSNRANLFQSQAIANRVSNPFNHLRPLISDSSLPICYT
jgi:hypothetical protein